MYSSEIKRRYESNHKLIRLTRTNQTNMVWVELQTIQLLQSTKTKRHCTPDQKNQKKTENTWNGDKGILQLDARRDEKACNSSRPYVKTHQVRLSNFYFAAYFLWHPEYMCAQSNFHVMSISTKKTLSKLLPTREKLNDSMDSRCRLFKSPHILWYFYTVFL